MGKWRESTWGDEIILEYGKALRGYDETPRDVRVFGTNGPVGWTDTPMALGPGIILGRKGAYRGVHYSPGPFHVIDTAYYVVPRRDLDMRWLFYAIQHYKLGEIDDGSPIPSTTRSAVYVSELTVPPSDEQRAIARILGALDDKIELNRRMNETLVAMARALFKSWFVDLDELPAGWQQGRVSDLCESLFSGGTPSTTNPAFWNGDVPWLSSGETRAMCIIETERFITQTGVDSSSTRFARVGATVIASAGQGNTRGQTSFLALDTYVNQSVVVLTANREVSSDSHLFFELERRYDEFRRVSDGHSSRGSLTTKLLGGLDAVIPERSAVEAFTAVAAPIMSRIANAMREARTLAAIRDTLLPKLISGEIRVKDAEKIVEDAA